jgi:hypothetical protein
MGRSKEIRLEATALFSGRANHPAKGQPNYKNCTRLWEHMKKPCASSAKPNNTLQLNTTCWRLSSNNSMPY